MAKLKVTKKEFERYAKKLGLVKIAEGEMDCTTVT